MKQIVQLQAENVQLKQEIAELKLLISSLQALDNNSSDRAIGNLKVKFQGCLKQRRVRWLMHYYQVVTII